MRSGQWDLDQTRLEHQTVFCEREEPKPWKKPEHGARSRAIREYLQKHPEANPKAIVGLLKQRGVQVSLGLADVVNYGNRAGALKGLRGNLPTGANVELLLRAKKFVDQVGGTEAALEAIELIEKLRD